MSSAADLPNERRLTGAAHDLWQRSGGLNVAEFADNAIVIVDPAGKATIIRAGAAIEATFGLAAGMRLNGLPGLATELRAACDLRELLDRAATTRIRREIGTALRIAAPNPTKADPFMLKNARKLPR